MKLQSSKVGKYKGRQYEKVYITISSKLLKSLGWKAGDDIQQEQKDGKIILSKKKK